MSDIPAEAGKPDDVRRALALLNAAGARIGNSLDLDTTARELLDVAVPQFCDLASVDLYPEVFSGEDPRVADGLDGTRPLRRVAFASAVSDGPITLGHHTGGAPDPDHVEPGGIHRYPAGSPYADALRTARVQRVTGTLVRSTLAVPMVARGRVLGLVQFSRTKGSEPFGERDAALGAELAARAAVCVDNARLYRREHERALILQRSLLPPDDPEAAGLDIACRYLPGSTASEVGGDWFDVIELPGHRTALVVGDVMGRGLRAAVAMGELRTAVRTLALLDLEPAEVLGALDEIAQGLGASRDGRGGRDGHCGPAADLSEVYLATCVYAVYDPVTRRCTFANAGHLPPVLVEPRDDGGERSALLLEVPKGVPLGVGGEPFEETEVELPDGALLALYTDGLVESRHQSLDEGLQALRTTLSGPDRPLEDVCDEVLGALETHHGEDDIALLLARIQGLPADSVGDWRLPAEPRSVARARDLTRRLLAAWDLEDLADTAELLVSELVTNALRHGMGVSSAQPGTGALPAQPGVGVPPAEAPGVGVPPAEAPGVGVPPAEAPGVGVPPAEPGGEIRLRLLLDRTLVCEVWDSGLVQPRRRRARDTDEGGRGLQLVDLLSSGWGSRRTPRGKTVWFELALPREGEPKPPDSAEALLSLF